MKRASRFILCQDFRTSVGHVCKGSTGIHLAKIPGLVWNTNEWGSACSGFIVAWSSRLSYKINYILANSEGYGNRFVYCTYHAQSRGGLQFFLQGEVGRRSVKVTLAAAISPYLISPTHPTHACMGKDDRPQHQGSPPYSSRTVSQCWLPAKVYSPYLRIAEHFLLSYFWDPECWSHRGLILDFRPGHRYGTSFTGNGGTSPTGKRRFLVWIVWMFMTMLIMWHFDMAHFHHPVSEYNY